MYVHIFRNCLYRAFNKTIEFEHLIVEGLKMSKTTVDQNGIHMYKL